VETPLPPADDSTFENFSPTLHYPKKNREVGLRVLGIARVWLSALAGLGVTVTVLVTVTVAIMVTVIVTTTTTVEAPAVRAAAVGIRTIPAAVARGPGLESGNLLFERRDALRLVGALGLGLLILLLELVAVKAGRGSNGPRP
jgi:hypothetical protein